VQAPEVAAVAMAMRAAVAEEQVVLVGELMDVNMFDRTFQMSVDGRTIGEGVALLEIGVGMHPA
jgi:hypothetical protein